jgi:hypothetical protein
VIYFAQADVIGHIKIGWHAGTNAADRLRELQTGCPTRLVLLGTMPGEQQTEADLHRRFAFSHAHGEWFRPVPELLAFIGQQSAGLQAGATEVQTRFVQIKILTVGGNRFSLALFDQLPWRCPVDWKRSDPDSLTTLGTLWGWLYKPKDSVAVLLWELDGSLYRFPIKSSFPYEFHPEWINRYSDPRNANGSDRDPTAWMYTVDLRVSKGLTALYKLAYQDEMNQWLSLPQLFIGVS